MRKKNQNKFTNDVNEEEAAVLTSKGFTQLEVINHGGYSRIYKAYSEKYQKYFAIKVTNMVDNAKKSARASVQNEITALKGLYHPNIVLLFDSFEENGISYIVLEYCGNGNLRHFNKKTPGIVSLLLIKTFKQVLCAVDFIHSRGFTHNDIKPMNIIIDEFNRPKVADFGMSEPFPENGLSEKYRGSLEFASPEIHKRIPFDPIKSDIWALGISFYEMLMDDLPWPKNKSLAVSAIVNGGCMIPSNVPRELSTLILKMTSMNPRARPTAAECLKMPLFTDPNCIERIMKKQASSASAGDELHFMPIKTKSDKKKSEEKETDASTTIKSEGSITETVPPTTKDGPPRVCTIPPLHVSNPVAGKVNQQGGRIISITIPILKSKKRKRSYTNPLKRPVI